MKLKWFMAFTVLLGVFGLYYLSKNTTQFQIKNNKTAKTEKQNFENLKDIYKNNDIDSNYIQKEKIIEATLDGKSKSITLDIKNYQIQINQIDNSNFPEIKLIVSVTDHEGNPLIVNPRFFQIIEHNKLITQEQIKKILRKEDKDNHQLRKEFPLNIILAIDKSGSMKGNLSLKESPIHFATQSAIELINQASPYDKISVLAFDGDIHYLGENYEAIPQLKSLLPKGSTALYGALFSSVKRLHIGKGSKAVILLSDGKNDTKGTINKNLKKISLQKGISLADQLAIPVFTIAYGQNSDDHTLKKIAKLTHANFFKTLKVEDINELYKKIKKILNSQYIIHYISNSLEEVTDVVFRLGKMEDQRSFETPSSVLNRHKKLISEINIIEKEKRKIKKNKESINNRLLHLEDLEKNIKIKNKNLNYAILEFEKKKTNWETLIANVKKEKIEIQDLKKKIRIKEKKNIENLSKIQLLEEKMNKKQKRLLKLKNKLQKEEENLKAHNINYSDDKKKLDNEISNFEILKKNYQEKEKNYQMNYKKYLKLKVHLDKKTNQLKNKETMISKTLKNLDLLYKSSRITFTEELKKYPK